MSSATPPPAIEIPIHATTRRLGAGSGAMTTLDVAATPTQMANPIIAGQINPSMGRMEWRDRHVIATAVMAMSGCSTCMFMPATEIVGREAQANTDRIRSHLEGSLRAIHSAGTARPTIATASGCDEGIDPRTGRDTSASSRATAATPIPGVRGTAVEKRLRAPASLMRRCTFASSSFGGESSSRSYGTRPHSAQEVLVERPPPRRVIVDPELRVHSSVAGRPKSSAKGGIVKKLCDRRRKGPWISGRNELASDAVIDDLR